MNGRDISAASAILAALLVLFTGALAVASLGWEYSRDTPLLNYVGFLIWEHGYAPYRDIFETSMPGTLGFHALVAGLGLTTDLGFMLLALGIVTAFAALGALVILPLGPAGAAIALPLIMAVMLMMGPGWILKIDMVALLPISAALVLAVWQKPGPVLVRQALIGVCFGLAGAMKPHLMLGAPVVVLLAYGLEYSHMRQRDMPVGALLGQIATALAGFTVWMGLVAVWLVTSGAWPSFVFVLTDYLPLHLEKTDWQEFVTPEEKRRISRAMMLRFGGYYLLVPLASLAPLLALWRWRAFSARQRMILAALCLLAAIYGFAPGLGGQFYVYYYFPFFFFSLLLVACAVSLLEAGAVSRVLRWAVTAVIVAGLIQFGARFYSPRLFQQQPLAEVARMEQALIKWVPAGGRVQPIDWTSGVVQAMLRQRILPATRFLYDYHFHHHVGSVINMDLRTEFIAALEADPPEVFMEATSFPRVSGIATSERFAARDAFVAARYRLVAEDPAFRVYLRRDLATP